MLSALRQARDAGVIIKASGVGRFDSLLEEAVLDLKRPENLADVIGYLRNISSDQARRIGAAALKRVLSEHTYARRGGRARLFFVK